ncbi:transposase IS166 family protein [Clostridium algidicarnis DSM 15099]|uniref:Transposase IS166 family protein n=2 Tax=Clostridium algidicarnis TaxID=37659 RepID=A0A2S6FUP6_9CLOT|nr:transposase IS166 family protein [Clostridium algidicarnis DSM 15099]
MEQITLSKHVRFGASSEKSEYDQLSLFDEAGNESNERVAEPELEEIKYKRKKG